MRYNEITRRYFEVAPGAGMLTGEGVCRARAGDPDHGTWVQFDVQAGLTVIAVRFLCFGCPHTIAISSWLAATAAGRPVVAALPEDLPTLTARFELPTEKMGRLLLIEDAWVAALRAAIANQR